jgi:Papain family cysteine protease
MKKLSLFAALAVLFFAISCKDNTENVENDNPTGLKFNTNNALEDVEEADIDEDGITLPASFTLAGPPIINQGNTSKCVAFSAGYYITSMYNGVTATNLDKSGSPDYLYGQYKKINKDNDCADGCYLFDDDSQGITGAAEILKTYGTTSWNQMPFVDANACPLTNATLETQAAANRIKDYYRLDKKEAGNTTELKSWLYAGYPLFFGIVIDQAFQDLEGSEIYSAKGGDADGGHAMVCVGYDDAKKAFKIANSWGADWADNGYTWIDYTFFTKLLNEDGAEVGVLIPNDIQRINMGKVSPIACGNAKWGDILLNNNRNQEIAIEMTGTNYTNDDADNIDAQESEFFTRIPQGTVKIKVLSADKATTIKEYTVTVSSCKEVILDIN